MKLLIDYSDAEIFAMTNEQLLSLGYYRIAQDESPSGFIWLVPVNVEPSVINRAPVTIIEGDFHALS